MTATTEVLQRDAARYGITYSGAAGPPAKLYPPSLHGTTHLPGGTDEIPGLATGTPAASSVTFSPSGLAIITGSPGPTNVQAALAAVDAALVADRARLTALEGVNSRVIKAADGIAGVPINNGSGPYVGVGTTAVADPELVLPVAANAVYIVRARIRYDATATADVKVGWTGPTGATMNWSPDAYISTTAASASSGTISRNSFLMANTVALGAVNAGTVLVANLGGVLRTDATHAGTLQFRWAQNVGDATDAYVRADSYLELVRYS